MTEQTLLQRPGSRLFYNEMLDGAACGAMDDPHTRLINDLCNLSNLLTEGASEADSVDDVLRYAAVAGQVCGSIVEYAPNTLFGGSSFGELHSGCTNARTVRSLHDAVRLIERAIKCATCAGDVDDRTEDLQDAAWIVDDLITRLR